MVVTQDSKRALFIHETKAVDSLLVFMLNQASNCPHYLFKSRVMVGPPSCLFAWIQKHFPPVHSKQGLEIYIRIFHTHFSFSITRCTLQMLTECLHGWREAWFWKLSVSLFEVFNCSRNFQAHFKTPCWVSVWAVSLPWNSLYLNAWT